MRLIRTLVIAVAVAVLLAPTLQAQRSFAAFVDPVVISELKTECLTNPNNYSATIGGVTQTLTQWYTAGADQAVADILNTTRAGITIYRTDVAPDEVKEAVALAQLTTAAGAATASLQAAWLNAFFSGSSVRLLTKAGADTRVLTNLLAVLTNGSASETRVRALASRTGTRGEQLWGCTLNTGPGCENVTVQAFHVTQARQLP